VTALQRADPITFAQGRVVSTFFYFWPTVGLGPSLAVEPQILEQNERKIWFRVGCNP